MENLLRSMDFSMLGNYDDAFNNHPLLRQHALGFDSVKMIIDKCRQLTDLILMDTQLTFQSISYICHNATDKLLRLDLCRLRVMDNNVANLIKTCPNMTYLNLADTWITFPVIARIVRGWSKTLMDLSLPLDIGLMDLRLDKDEPDPKVRSF